jgi:hypothetical protein
VLSHLVTDCVRHFGRAKLANLSGRKRYLEIAQAYTRDEPECSDARNGVITDALTELRSHVADLNFRVFYERSIDLLSVKEIAVMHGIPLDQVRKRHERMMKKFRNILVRRIGIRDSRYRGDNTVGSIQNILKKEASRGGSEAAPDVFIIQTNSRLAVRLSRRGLPTSAVCATSREPRRRLNPMPSANGLGFPQRPSP